MKTLRILNWFEIDQDYIVDGNGIVREAYSRWEPGAYWISPYLQYTKGEIVVFKNEAIRVA